MTSCSNCGAFVTDDFARVFGDNDDEVHACPECSDDTVVRNGAAAKPDFERRCPPDGVRRA